MIEYGLNYTIWIKRKKLYWYFTHLHHLIFFKQAIWAKFLSQKSWPVGKFLSCFRKIEPSMVRVKIFRDGFSKFGYNISLKSDPETLLYQHIEYNDAVLYLRFRHLVACFEISLWSQCFAKGRQTDLLILFCWFFGTFLKASSEALRPPEALLSFFLMKHRKCEEFNMRSCTKFCHVFYFYLWRSVQKVTYVINKINNKIMLAFV